MTRLRLGLLGSTRGTHMLTLAQAIEQQHLPATIELVLSNQADALILSRAKDRGYPAFYLDPKGLKRQDYDQRLSDKLEAFRIDLVVLVGYMRILSAAFVSQWRGRIINVHPSLLPLFAGGMDRQVHQAVLDSGARETGCTVHQVTEQLDGGPILVQKSCPVLANDSVESLRNKVQALEGLALMESIKTLAEARNS
ncbi:MAG: phosphoribosylglycinamide formyltransferase [Prosthecobacter sp.]|nr:phosphoribosylglycinamide formyltransferase [Prosthecobacter sp.]